MVNARPVVSVVHACSEALTPGVHHYIAVIPEPYCHSRIPLLPKNV